MVQSDSFMGKEGKATMGGTQSRWFWNPVLLPLVLV